MSVDAINRLIKRLDDDGDGEVDFRWTIMTQTFIHSKAAINISELTGCSNSNVFWNHTW